MPSPVFWFFSLCFHLMYFFPSIALECVWMVWQTKYTLLDIKFLMLPTDQRINWSCAQVVSLVMFPIVLKSDDFAMLVMCWFLLSICEWFLDQKRWFVMDGWTFWYYVDVCFVVTTWFMLFSKCVFVLLIWVVVHILVIPWLWSSLFELWSMLWTRILQ